MANDTFALAISAHNTLVVFGPAGERTAELTLPTIEKSVAAGNERFSLSYGHDVNGQLQAIVEPSEDNPKDLHFVVLGHHIHADSSAVITLTFSDDIDRVTIDPGVTGLVIVDGHPIKAPTGFAENWNPAPTPAEHKPRPPASAVVAAQSPSEEATPQKKQAAVPKSPASSEDEASVGKVATTKKAKKKKASKEVAETPQATLPPEKSPEPAPSQTPSAIAGTASATTITPLLSATPAIAATGSATPVATAATGTSSPVASVPDVSANLPLPGQPTPPGAAADQSLPGPGAIANPGQALPDQGSDIGLAPVPTEPPPPLPPLPRLELDVPKQFASVLPPLPDSEKNPLYQPSVFVKSFNFVGNHVYSSAKLAALVAKYTGRQISIAELEAAAQTITLKYINDGYINSGALIADQHPKDGVITLQIVEGKLTKIVVQGNHWFQTWWLRNQIRQAAGDPFNFTGLKLGVQNLRENPTIDQVNAEVQPGGVPGQSEVDVKVKDTIPFHYGVEINDYRPPSVGSTIIQTHFTDLNLSGNNDPLNLSYGIATLQQNTLYASHLDIWSIDYTFPITPWDTTMEVSADRNNAGIQEAPFNQLAIKSRLQEYHLEFHQPIITTPNQSLVLSVELDERRNVSALYGLPFSLSPGAVDGVEQVFVPRFIQEYTYRTQQNVFSARSQFSLGLDDFNSTLNAAPPDGKFFAWLGQVQYIQKLGQSDNLIVSRFSGQLADRPLLSLEQSQLGGNNTVRGYLENQVLRDNSFLASVECRIPLVVDKDHNSLFAFAPFTDFGLGWNNVNAYGPDPFNTKASGDETVAMPSVGMGLLVTPTKYFNAQLYWGYGLNRRQVPDGPSLQNQGVEFSISSNPF